MQIPQNILEELERRRQMAQASAEPVAPVTPPSTPDGSLASHIDPESIVIPETLRVVAEAKPPYGGLASWQTPKEVSPPPVVSGVEPVGGETSAPTIAGGSLFFDYLTRLAIFAAIFFTPLFFFSASDALGLPKQLLLSSLALTALAGWVCKTIASGHIVWRRSFLTWAALAVAASAVLSSLFSSSFWVSFLGDTGRYEFSGVSLLAYAIMFIVASQSLVRRDVKAAVGLWLVSTFLVTAVSLLKFIGFEVWPWGVAKDKLFNPIGGPFSLSLFVLAAVPFMAAVWPELRRRWQKIALALVVLVELALAALIDFNSGWVALAVAGLALAVVNFVRAPRSIGPISPIGPMGAAGWSFQRSIALPAVLVVVAAALWLVSGPRVGDFSFPAEINPSYRASLEIMAQTLKDHLVFGSGLETFPYVYAQFKSASLNQTNFWGVNFNNSMAEVITWVTTAGLFGAAAWLLFAAGFLVYALTRTRAEPMAEAKPPYGGLASWQNPKEVSPPPVVSGVEPVGGGTSAPAGGAALRAGLLASWIFILASKFLYGTTLPLEFMFWIIPALFLLSQEERISPMGPIGPIGHIWSYKFQVGSVKTLAVFFVLMVVLLGTLLGGYFTARRWIAELTFVKAISTEAKPETRDQILNGINGAIITNPYEVRYFRVLTQVLFQKMNDIVAAIQARPADARQANTEEAVQLRNLAVRAISSVQRTRLLDPKNVGVAVDAAESFRGLTAFVQGADDVAIQNYETASDLEPVNPFIRTQLGQLYLLKSGLLVQGFEADEDWLAKAKTALDKALDLNSNYANARFFRALITDHEGDKPKAWEEFRVLQATNPNNQLVARIVQNLEAGLPALGVPPAPATPPQSPAAGEAKGVPPANP